MLNDADKEKSFKAVREFAESLGGTPDNFRKKVEVRVKGSEEYLYRGIEIHTSYNYGYMDYQVELMWEDDEEQVDYKTLGLHGTYSTNFQLFSFSGSVLRFKDGGNTVNVFAR